MQKIKAGIIILFLNFSEKRRNQKNITVIILSQLYLFFLAFCIAFFIFKLLTDFEGSTLALFLTDEFPYVTGMFARFLTSWLIILLICELLYFLTFFLYVPLFALYPLLSAAGAANAAKINFRNEPFVFTDLLLFKESIDIAAQYPLGLDKYLPFLIPVFVLLIILPLFLRRIKLNIIKRLIPGISALIIILSFFTHAFIAEETLIEKTARQTVWNLAYEYRQNGFILEFMLSVKRSLMFAPSDYNRNNTKQYALNLGYPEDYIMPDINKTPEELPNVIVIMNEAYWDTANLTGIAFNRDPLESVREIMRRNGNAKLLSPHIGGGTSNIEFEFLTGKNIVYYPPASIVYQQFVTKKHWSLAWYFRDFGYATTAIHPYYDWFWKRNTVYPLLGFENIYFNDGSLNYIDVKGSYISDRAVSDEIISRYKMFSDNNKRPAFTFAVTMQNHGPYYVRYSGDDKQINLINQLDDNPKNAVESFAEGVRFASEAFIYLTEYFKEIERPTYIIMFGDHSPAAIVDMAELYASAEPTEMTPEVLYNRYVTPLVIWSNKDSPETDLIIQNIGTVTAQMLTEEIFNITGMPKPAYIKMLENIKQTAKGFTGHYILGENGVYSPSGDFEKIKDIYEKMRIVQYDATLGRNYLGEE